MPLRVVSRTPSSPTLAKIPDSLQLGGVVLAQLHQSGVLQQVDDRLRLARRDGHGARGLFALAVTFLLAGPSWGIRPFLAVMQRPVQRRLAGLAGLKALPSSAAVSRILAHFSHEQTRPFIESLLGGDERMAEILRDPHVQHRDANGQAWHVLDVDPTVEPFRRRSLPEDDSMPPATRRAIGASGYTGHKRGELRIRHVPVQHAGSGLWLGYRLTPTSESILSLLDPVVRQGRRTLVEAGTGERIVVRADGEFGSVGAMATCLDAGVDFVSRLSRYSLLDREDVMATLARARWTRVPSGGDGPVREAADLGTFELHPSEGAAGPGRPVSARVVVTRFRRASDPDHGVLRDGYQYELLVTSLSADAWPAADLVALYFGRAAIENRFAQEDREFGIDRTFSFHPAGQEWMSGVALFLWNVLICMGVATAPLARPTPAQKERPSEAVLSGEGAAFEPATTSAPPANVEAAATSDQEPPPIEAAATGSSTASRANREEEPAAVSNPSNPEDAGPQAGGLAEIRRELWSIVRVAFADLDRVPGWRLDEVRQEVRCPHDKRLFLFSADPYREASGRGQNRLMIRTELAACDGCPVRSACTASTRANSYKQISRAVDVSTAARAQELLRASRRPRAPAPGRTPTGTPFPPNSPGGTTKPLFIPPASLAAGPFVPASPLFLPAAARRRVRTLVQHLSLEVTIGRLRATPALTAHPLLAADDRARRHTRHTFATRAARWAADPVVSIVVTKPAARRLVEKLFSIGIQERAA